MSDDHPTDDPGGTQPQQEIIPPTPIERVMWGAVDVTDEMRDTSQLSLLWIGLSDGEREIVIEGEMALTARRKRKFDDWLKIGEASLLLQDEVKRQSNSTSNRGKRYNRFWRELAPPQLRELSYADRTHAVDLWQARDAILAWWETVPSKQRDRWNHPLVIKRAFERARHIAMASPTRDEDDEDRPRRREPAVPRGQAAAIDDATVRLHDAVDRIEDRVEGTARHFDLSTPQLVHESAESFREIYGGVHGDEAVQQFTEALRDANPNWAPGSDWWHDDPEEIAGYLLAGDEQKAVQIARAIIRKYRAARRQRRADQPAPATAGDDDAGVVADAPAPRIIERPRGRREAGEF